MGIPDIPERFMPVLGLIMAMSLRFSLRVLFPVSGCNRVLLPVLLFYAQTNGLLVGFSLSFCQFYTF